jgi:hypothetical protein
MCAKNLAPHREFYFEIFIDFFQIYTIVLLQFILTTGHTLPYNFALHTNYYFSVSCSELLDILRHDWTVSSPCSVELSTALQNSFSFFGVVLSAGKLSISIS